MFRKLRCLDYFNITYDKMRLQRCETEFLFSPRQLKQIISTLASYRSLDIFSAKQTFEACLTEIGSMFNVHS